MSYFDNIHSSSIFPIWDQISFLKLQIFLRMLVNFVDHSLKPTVDF